MEEKVDMRYLIISEDIYLINIIVPVNYVDGIK